MMNKKGVNEEQEKEKEKGVERLDQTMINKKGKGGMGRLV
jgi:hypothetical protein